MIKSELLDKSYRKVIMRVIITNHFVKYIGSKVSIFFLKFAVGTIRSLRNAMAVRGQRRTKALWITGLFC